MCGFAGLIFGEARALGDEQAWRRRFELTCRNVVHRGNDGEGQLRAAGVWLHHFRLAFQDVAQGGQPMVSRDGRYVIVFNGEIYNHLSLRADISARSGHVFETRSDTETLLAGFQCFGPEFAQRLEGEYSFVITRTDGDEIFATRDPSGVKPLYFGFFDVDTARFALARKSYEFETPFVCFASEMKGLALPRRWNREGALRQFCGLFEPIRTPFENIIQIPGGALFSARRTGAGLEKTYRCQLVLASQPVRGLHGAGEPRSVAEDRELEHRFRDALAHSVRERLLSDVPLGVYLSGGVDSRAIAYELARAHEERNRGVATAAVPMKSFTVGFRDQGYDETADAMAFARAFGFDPQVITVDDAALTYSYPLAVHASENIQPYTNGAAKWWLSLFTRRHVRGVLTGDGADELLCGYPSFRYAAWWKFALRARGEAQNPLDGLARAPLGSLRRDGVYIRRFAKDAGNPWQAGSSSFGGGEDFRESLRLWGVAHPLFTQVRATACAILGDAEGISWLERQGESVRSWFLLGYGDPGRMAEREHALLADPAHALTLWQNYFVKTHLPVQVLNWVGDRMEMANTLEGRTPFLSGSLRALVSELRDVHLVRGLRDKALLRQSYRKLLTGEFALAPKRQFNAPFLHFEALARRFGLEQVFERTGLAGSDTLKRIDARLALLAEAPDPESSFMRTHLLAARQTALCLAIVQRSLVEEDAPQRDDAFEEQVLRRHATPALP